MKSTIANNKQLFNVKEIAYNKTVDELTDGQMGIFPSDSDTSIASGGPLPDNFYIVLNHKGKFLHSFSDIEKATIINAVKKDYTPERVNVWKGIIDNCKCFDNVKLILNIDDFDYTDKYKSDFVVEVMPNELDCEECDEHPVYHNHVWTKYVYEAAKAKNSQYYEVSVEDESGNAIADIDAFIATNKADNTDDDDTNDSEKLVLVITAKAKPAPAYNDLDQDYEYPRSIRLHPALFVDDKAVVSFTETQTVIFEVGAGPDMRAMEFDNFGYYTKVTGHPRWSGFQNPDMSYQFENDKQYSTVSIEYMTDKTEKNNGDKRLFGIIFGTNISAIYNDLKTLFGL